MEFINKILSGGIVPLAVVIVSIYFLIALKFRPLRNPVIMIETIFCQKNKSGVSPIRAVIFALAGTLGVGNIVGVSSAIMLGGAGAVFWMWISALLAMILKYSEVILAVNHRRIRDGGYFGGAMYYMRDCFNSCHKNLIAITFSLIFTLFCLINGITMGCVIQSNSISSSLNNAFGANEIGVGIMIAIGCIAIFFFNGKRIFSICEKAVPFVSVIYILMSLAVIIIQIERIPDVFKSIVNDAFSFTSFGGGLLGFFTSRAIRFGTIRGLFSNEAGCGTSPIAHATANTQSSCSQGILGILEVFIDTIVVCTMTAFVILLGENFSSDPMLYVINSFKICLGEWSVSLLGLCVAMFGFATIVCWGYYGRECIYYISKRKKLESIYYCIYTAFAFLGAFISTDSVWELADLAVGVMTIMNLLVLLIMRNEIKKETELFFAKKGLPNGSPNEL